MANDNAASVSTAFEMALEELEINITLEKQSVADALSSNDFRRIREATNRAEKLTGIKDRLTVLIDDWTGVIDGSPEKKKQAKRRKRREMGRIEPGLKTPESAFIIPILDALDTMGGPAKAFDVLDRVEPSVKSILKDIDYESLASGPGRPRWRSTASAARWRLVRDGLLRDDSPYGTWEISDKGRHFLAEHDRL